MLVYYTDTLFCVGLIILWSLHPVKNLLTSPSKMSLTAVETALYQKILLEVEPLTLNLMAVKVNDTPEDFNGWCKQLLNVCLHEINRDLMDEPQFKPLKKMTTLLTTGVSLTQIKMASVSPWELYEPLLLAQETQHALPERLKLLDYISALNIDGLGHLITEDKLAFVGKHTSGHDPKVYDFDVQWFGNTKSVKGLHQLLSVNPGALDKALSEIPKTGEVKKAQYDAFVEEFVAQMTGAEEKSTLTVATRLLAMRRPDQFVVVAPAKISDLCQGLDIVKFKITDFDGYWNSVITKIRTMHWYNSEQPSDEASAILWKNRVILMDLLFYIDEQQALKSNYLQLLSKPKKVSSKTTKTRRSKESAIQLVDRVLGFDDTPDFLIAQRSSIISQVEAGKDIDDVITLITKIFSD